MTKTLAVGICAVALVAAHTAAGRLVPTPIGAAPAYQPNARNPVAESGSPIGRLTCERSSGSRVGVHLELFAHGKAAVVPAGIGVARPLRRSGAFVLSGRCSYPVRTREPTGVIELTRGRSLTLGDFFAVWGRSLGTHRLVAFRAHEPSRVRAFVNGRRYEGAPASIVLHRHLEIVVELGKLVPPHASYRFRKGL